MGILEEQKPAVQKAITADIAPRENEVSVSSRNIEIQESRVVPLFEPIQTVQTNKQVASGVLSIGKQDITPINIIPFNSNEIYSLDVINEDGKVVYSVNAHSGNFKSNIALPRGNYTYFINTERNDMPFTVMFKE